MHLSDSGHFVSGFLINFDIVLNLTSLFKIMTFKLAVPLNVFKKVISKSNLKKLSQKEISKSYLKKLLQKFIAKNASLLTKHLISESKHGLF